MIYKIQYWLHYIYFIIERAENMLRRLTEQPISVAQSKKRLTDKKSRSYAASIPYFFMDTRTHRKLIIEELLEN